MTDTSEHKNLLRLDSVAGWQKKIALAITLLCLVPVVLVFLYDWNLGAALLVGLLLNVFLSAITFLVLLKMGITDKKVFQLFFIAFFIHLISSLGLYVMIYHTSLRPLGGGGDFDLYQNNAIEIAHRLQVGNFSLQGMFTEHYFAVIIGIIYALTIPHIIVGQLFIVWLAALSAILTYLIVLEIGGSKPWAFAIGIMSSIYPSYLYFGSLLLKETMLVPLVLVGILLSLRLYKKFSLVTFWAFFLAVSGVIHFRFYIGFALLFSVMICWFFTSNLGRKDRVIQGVIMIVVLGFSPFLMGYGYMGNIPISMYLNKKQIVNLREVVYAPPTSQQIYATQASQIQSAGISPEGGEAVGGSINTKGQVVQDWDLAKAIKKAAAEGKNLDGRVLTKDELVKASGSNSSFSVSLGFESPFSFVISYGLSFLYTVLGPLPWQIHLKRQMISLAEMIPFWIFIVVIIYAVYACIKTRGFSVFLHKYKYVFPLLVFCLFAAGALSLFINNFGIIVRIRMPIFILLLCILSLDTSLTGVFARFRRKEI